MCTYTHIQCKYTGTFKIICLFLSWMVFLLFLFISFYIDDVHLSLKTMQGNNFFKAAIGSLIQQASSEKLFLFLLEVMGRKILNS